MLADPTARRVTALDKIRLVQSSLALATAWKDTKRMSVLLSDELQEALDLLREGQEAINV